MENNTAENKNENKLTILDKLGGWLLFVSAICLVFVFVFFFCNKPEKAVPSEITLFIQTDSTGTLDMASRQAIDSLTVLVKQQDTFVRERYALLAEQKEHENGLMSFAGIIVSIILGIFGFFGYKSFKSIEDKAVTNADDKVKKKVNTEMVTMQKTLEKELTGTIDKRFSEEYKERLGQEVGKQLNDNYNESISAKLNFIKDHGKAFKDMQKRVNQLEQFVSQLQDQGVVIKFPAITEDKDDIKEFAEQRNKQKGGEKTTEEKGEEQ